MSSLERTYIKELRKEYGLWPIWTPLKRLRIGDCGTLERGVFFKRKGHISEYGVAKDALRTARASRDPLLRFMTRRGVKLATQANGKNSSIPNIPQGEAGARVTFARGKATFLEAVGVSERELRSERLLEDELRALVELGIFPPHYVVITDIVRATSARVFVSTSAGQSFTVRAGTGAAVAGVEIANIAVQAEASFTSDVGVQYDGTKGATPLYRPMGFNIGGAIRRALRSPLTFRDRVPRIVVESIKGKPAVGASLTVRPVEAQEFAVAPVDSAPFVVEPTALKPFVVEPILVDIGVLGDFAPRTADVVGEVRRRGVLLGSVDGVAAIGESLAITPFRESPIIIQPIDGEPLLVKTGAGEVLAMEAATVGRLDTRDPAITASAWAPAIDEPLAFGYVDFDAEFDDTDDADI
jgi:hypothetical protein